MKGVLAARFDRVERSAVVVVGSGVAGLAAALAAPGPVRLLTKTALGDGASRWAQGGIAAAVGPGDSPKLHAADTLAVGGGLGVPAIVEALVKEGPNRVRRLIALGADFDSRPGGELSLGQEAAHSRRRIVHARDATGHEIVRALLATLRETPHVTLEERVFACELVRRGHRVVGLVARGAGGERVLHLTGAVVLATGGVGQLYAATTNPPEATGDGLAMAARAGARIADAEFVQFHPTALAVGTPAMGAALPGDAPPLALLTEALRGEGALLLDERGERFMLAEHPAGELAPRDVVARAIWRRWRDGGRVLLDARLLADGFAERFPTVLALALERGCDPRREPVPVIPAAHYHMGGVAVDARGRSSLPGLWAAGEVAATGLHGANRLASNSLLEALVYGARVGEDLQQLDVEIPGGPAPADLPDVAAGGEAPALRAELRTLMDERVGVERDGAGLRHALRRLEKLRRLAPRGSETANLADVARLVATAAWLRRESRGGHHRSDFPASDPAWQRRLVLRVAGDTVQHELAAPADVAELLRPESPRSRRISRAHAS